MLYQLSYAHRRLMPISLALFPSRRRCLRRATLARRLRPRQQSGPRRQRRKINGALAPEAPCGVFFSARLNFPCYQQGTFDILEAAFLFQIPFQGAM
jgi:hypothetical protein